jgi:hypothetical protein
MNEQEVAVAEEFRLALARNNWEGAQAVVNCLDLPLVATSTFSFKEVEGKLQDAWEQESLELRGNAGTLFLKAVSQDTPMAPVDVWNVTDRVALVLISSNEICDARVMDGKVDFFVCAGALDCPGGTSCGWMTNVMGGKDTKGHLVVKMDLPQGGGKVFAIPVKTLGSGVKRPKIFSLTTLPQVNLPYEVLTEGWNEALMTLKLHARDWKFFFEVY